MKRTDISKIAKDALADIYMLREHSKKVEETLDDLLADLLDNINCDSEKERDEYVAALQELKDKQYIDINIEMEDVPKIDSVMLTEKGEKYVSKYMNYEGDLTMAYKNELRDLNDNLLKLSKSGGYIVSIGIIGLLCNIINTAINIYKAFK